MSEETEAEDAMAARSRAAKAARASKGPPTNAEEGSDMPEDKSTLSVVPYAKEILPIIKDYWPQVEAVYLYGSHASGQSWADSDVDLAVLLPPSLAKQCGNLALHEARFALEDALARQIDLVNLRLCPTVLQKEIVYTGQRLYEANRHEADALEGQVLSAYQKLNQERAEILKEGLRSGRFYNV